jgi:hypothetical protein
LSGKYRACRHFKGGSDGTRTRDCHPIEIRE